MSDLATPAWPASDFPDEIEASLRQVRDQCGAIVEAVCGSAPRAKDVSDGFGVHAKLGWQLWNVAYSQPLTALRFLPNEKGIESWLRAAAQRKVPEALLDLFRDAARNLNKVIESHAGDREMFEMLVDSQLNLPNDDAKLRWRKQAFTGNGFMFGARAKTLLASAIFFPSETPNSFSIVRLHGLVELVRTRVGVRWPIATLVVQQTDGTDTMPGREPLARNQSKDTVPFMPSYCSQPLPAVERRTDGETICDELLPGPVGLTGATTIFTGEILHDVGPTHGIKGGEVAHFGSGVRTPAELLVSDHFVHRSLFPLAHRELRVYGELISNTSRDDRDRLDVPEELRYLGRGLARVRTAEIPNYAELLGEAFDRIGFDAADFDVYRVRMPYPPIPASVMVRHTLPPPPDL